MLRRIRLFFRLALKEAHGVVDKAQWHVIRGTVSVLG
jgi:hypothetical protein